MGIGLGKEYFDPNKLNDSIKNAYAELTSSLTSSDQKTKDLSISIFRLKLNLSIKYHSELKVKQAGLIKANQEDPNFTRSLANLSMTINSMVQELGIFEGNNSYDLEKTLRENKDFINEEVEKFDQEVKGKSSNGSIWNSLLSCIPSRPTYVQESLALIEEERECTRIFLNRPNTGISSKDLINNRVDTQELQNDEVKFKEELIKLGVSLQEVDEGWDCILRGMRFAVQNKGCPNPHYQELSRMSWVKKHLRVPAHLSPALWSYGFHNSMLAREHGCMPLEATPLGSILNRLTLSAEFDPVADLWDTVSSEYCRLNTGSGREMHIFLSGVDETKTLIRKEIGGMSQQYTEGEIEQMVERTHAIQLKRVNSMATGVAEGNVVFYGTRKDPTTGLVVTETATKSDVTKLVEKLQDRFDEECENLLGDVNDKLIELERDQSEAWESFNDIKTGLHDEIHDVEVALKIRIELEHLLYDLEDETLEEVRRLANSLGDQRIIHELKGKNIDQAIDLVDELVDNRTPKLQLKKDALHRLKNLQEKHFSRMTDAIHTKLLRGAHAADPTKWDGNPDYHPWT